MAGRALTPSEAGQVYDRIGRFQDWQRFYESPAVSDLVAHAYLEDASSVFELGCGTGAFAASVLRGRLPANATYVGADVSSKMVALAEHRLARFGSRVSVQRVDGQPPLAQPSDRFDRFMALYVFDLLEESLARALVDEARRLLVPNGRLCLVSLTNGSSPTSRALCAAWNRVFDAAPKLVGGCRPIDLTPLLEGWRIEHRASITAWSVPSQVVVASPT
jgi:SAM-dependent methyltransferase